MLNKIFFATSCYAVFACAASATEKFDVPFEALLKATSSLQSPTSGMYSVVGILQCHSIAREVPPYTSSKDCTVTLDSGSVALSQLPSITEEQINDLVSRLMEIKLPTGPGYGFVGEFNLISSSPSWGRTSFSASVSPE